MASSVDHADRVSVVIPTFNRGPQLKTAIDSAANQTLRPWEIIVVDDGSEMKTERLLGGYGDLVRYVRQEHAGPATARNRGIDLAKGDFIAFLDSDDQWLPEKLRVQMDRFRHRPTLGIVASEVIYHHRCGNLLSQTADLSTDSIRDKFCDNRPMVTASVVVRSQCLRSVGGFDESLLYGEDWDLFYRIVRSFDAEIIPQHLVVIDRSDKDNGLMSDIRHRERLVSDTLTVLDRIYSYPENQGMQMRRQRAVHAFLRWVALRDVDRNPKFARKYLSRTIMFRKWDMVVYRAILRTYLNELGLHRVRE